MPNSNPKASGSDVDEALDVNAVDEQVEESLEDLQVSKLKEEIRHLRLPLWKRPGFTVPLATGLIGLLLAWVNGVFDIKRDRLQLERDQLRFETKQLETLKNELAHQTQELKAAQMRAEANYKEVAAAFNARPILELDRISIPETKEARFEVTNTGSGLAKLLPFRAYLPSGEEVILSSRESWLHLLNSLAMNETWVTWFAIYETRSLAPGNSQFVVRVEPGLYSPQRAEALLTVFESVPFSFCYCAIDGTCSELIKGNVPEERSSCG